MLVDLMNYDNSVFYEIIVYVFVASQPRIYGTEFCGSGDSSEHMILTLYSGCTRFRVIPTTNVMSHVQIIFQKENLTLLEYLFVLHLMVQSTERLVTFLTFFKICTTFSGIHSFEVTVHYGLRNAHRTVFCVVMPACTVFMQGNAFWSCALKNFRASTLTLTFGQCP